MNAIRSKLITVAAVLGTLALCQLHAGTMTLNTTVWSGASGGGQFIATLDTTESFQTFCLEYSEYFTPRGIYEYSITDEAIGGGVNNGTPGAQGGDPISKGTAALYKAFRNGTLPDYFGPSQLANADVLQKAFWILEDEISFTSNKYLNDLTTIFGFASLEDAKVNFGGTDVAVLHLTTSNHGPAQDQLYLRVPDGGSTAALLGAALLAIAAFRRRLV